MHHLIAYSETQDNAALANVAAAPDDSVNVQGDNIRVPRVFNRLGGAVVVGAVSEAARILAPSLREIVNVDIGQLNVGAEPLVPTPFDDRFDNPIELTIGENLRFQVQSDGAGTERQTCGLWLTDGPRQPVQGDIFTVRVTGATAMVAFSWTTSALTFSQELPTGRYQLVGARFIAATLLLARLVIPGVAHRPGCIGYDAVGDKELDLFRGGKLGVWAEFDTVQGISLEGFAVSTDATQEGFLDLIKIGPLVA